MKQIKDNPSVLFDMLVIEEKSKKIEQAERKSIETQKEPGRIYVPKFLGYDEAMGLYHNHFKFRHNEAIFETEELLGCNIVELFNSISSSPDLTIEAIKTKNELLKNLQEKCSNMIAKWIDLVMPTWFCGSFLDYIDLDDENYPYTWWNAPKTITPFHLLETLEIIWNYHNDTPVDLNADYEGIPFSAWRDIIEAEKLYNEKLDGFQELSQKIETEFQKANNLLELSKRDSKHPEPEKEKTTKTKAGRKRTPKCETIEDIFKPGGYEMLNSKIEKEENINAKNLEEFICHIYKNGYNPSEISNLASKGLIGIFNLYDYLDRMGWTVECTKENILEITNKIIKASYKSRPRSENISGFYTYRNNNTVIEIEKFKFIGEFK